MSSTIANSSELVAEQVKALLVQPLTAQSVVLSLPGIRRFTTSGGVPIRLPKLVDYYNLSDSNLTASATFGWTGESELISEADVDFGEVVLLPNTLKSIKVLHRISSELARHAVVDVVAAIKDAFVRRIASKVDWTFLRSTGDGGTTPVGLLNVSGRQTDSVTWDVDSIYDAVGLMLAANAEPGAWLMHPDLFIAARKLKSATSGEYLMTPDPTAGNVFRLVGTPVRVSTLMPADRVLLVDPSQLAVGSDLDASIKVDTSRYLEYDEVAIRCITRMDLAALNASAIVDLTVTG